MRQNDSGENELKRYLEISPQAIRDDLRAIQARSFPAPGQRQESFNAVEILLCYGLFRLVNPHRYGGANIASAPEPVHKLAQFFQRKAGSITSKMLNLDGSREHGSRWEPLLYATLVDQPDRYVDLYRGILQVARDLALGEDILPDFLGVMGNCVEPEALEGQYELPASSHRLLQEARAEYELKRVDQVFQLGDRLTEKLVEQKVRLVQNYFARDVLLNCEHTCVFCGFAPRSLGGQNGLLRASHIKPWSVANEQERVDVRNGLAACPTHDAAFDYGYLTVEDTHSIIKANILQKSIANDAGVRPYFEDILSAQLILPAHAKKPVQFYLEYHRLHIFRA